MRPSLLRQFWFRFALLQAGVSAVLASLLFGVLYLATTHYARKQIADEIERDAAALATGAGADGAGLVGEVRRRAGLTSTTAWYQVVDADGRVLAGNMWPEKLAPGWHVLPMPEADPDDEEADEHALLTLVVAVAPHYRLAVARDTYREVELEESLGTTFLWALALAVLTGFAAALLIARLLRRRVAPLIATAAAVGDGDLSRRVPAVPGGDEFDAIALAVNDMLDRIERLLQRVRQISVGVAHDLRTPLTRVRHGLERLQAAGGSEAVQGELRGVVGDLDAALSTFDAILRLARVEEGAASRAFAQVDLGALAQEVCDIYAPVAEDAGKRLLPEIGPDAALTGDRPLLLQMIVNALENAIRHTPPRTTIRLRVQALGAHVVVDVIDNGPGIAAADRERALLPHVRLDASRSGEGSGLGLALCKAIAELHGGSLRLLDAAPGLQVRFTLPVAAASAR